MVVDSFTKAAEIMYNLGAIQKDNKNCPEKAAQALKE